MIKNHFRKITIPTDHVQKLKSDIYQMINHDKIDDVNKEKQPVEEKILSKQMNHTTSFTPNPVVPSPEQSAIIKPTIPIPSPITPIDKQETEEIKPVIPIAVSEIPLPEPELPPPESDETKTKSESSSKFITQSKKKKSKKKNKRK